MRITFILSTANMSGGVRVVAIYAKLLAERGHKVVIISPPPHISRRNKVKSFLIGKGWPVTPSRLPSHLDGLNLDHRVLDCFRPPTDDDVPDSDVVIATIWYTADWVNKLSDAKGKKVYFIQHHEVAFEKSAESSYYLPLHKIVIAKWLQRVMKEKYGDDEVDIVSNAVDRGQFFAESRNKKPQPTVGFLYSPISFKGMDTTLKAIELLNVKFPDLKVITFGTYLPEEHGGLNPSIEFHYSPAQEKISELYAACDVWLTASRSEGFNLPAMEAMACRTPVISTRTGWPEEVIHNGENGYLVDFDNAQALADAVSEILLLSKPKWEKMSKNALNTVKNSSWEASTDLFESALINACHQR